MKEIPPWLRADLMNRLNVFVRLAQTLDSTNSVDVAKPMADWDDESLCALLQRHDVDLNCLIKACTAIDRKQFSAAKPSKQSTS